MHRTSRQILSPYVVPLLIFIFSLVLRVSWVSQGPYHVDCLNLIMQAQKSLETGRLHGLFGSGYPLLVVVASGAVFIAKLFSFENYAVAVNLTSVVFSSLAVLVFYHLARELFDEAAAVFGSLLFSVTPLFLGLSIYATSHTLCVFFLLAGILALLKFLKTEQRNFFWLSAISFGLMGSSRLQDLILMAIPLTFLYFFGEAIYKKSSSFGRKFKGYLVLCIAVGVITAFSHFLLISHNHQGYTSQLQNFLKQGLFENFLGFFSSRILVTFAFLNIALTITGFILAVAGLRRLVHERWVIGVFLLLWIIVPCEFYGNLRATLTSRFFSLVLPAFILALGFMCSVLIKKHGFIKLAVYLVFLSMMYTLYKDIAPVLSQRHKRAIIPEYVGWVDQKIEPEAVIIAADESPFFQYYGQRKVIGRPMVVVGSLSEGDWVEFKVRINGFLDQGRPVYITDEAIYSYNAVQFINFMDSQYIMTWVGERDFEGWHRGEMISDINPSSLYRLEKK